MIAHYDAEKVKQAISKERFGDLLEYSGAKVNRRSGHATCAAHGGDNPQALHYSEKGGTVLWNCFTANHGGDALTFIMEREGLNFPAAVEWLGDWLGFAPEPSHPQSRPTVVKTTRYDIRDSSGTLVATHIRRDLSDGTKDKFLWERNGKMGLEGLPTGELPLYGSEMLASVPMEALVFLTEGEKAADALLKHGFNAVASVTGASGTPGRGALAVLRGRDVVLWPDHDEVGRDHMMRIGQALSGSASRLRLFPWGEDDGDDAADFFDGVGTREQLTALVSTAPDWKPEELEGRDPHVVMVPFSEIKQEAVEWLWEGRIPFGAISIIDGIPGVGKSTLSCEIAASASTGRSLPGGGSNEIVNVAMLSAEDSLGGTVKHRLEAAGADLDKVFALKVERYGNEIHPTLAKNLKDIETAIRKWNLRLLIIDPLMAYLGSGINSYNDQEVREVLAPLAKLAHETGTAVVFVRHPRKSTDGGAINSGGGSIGITGAARSVLLLGRHPDDIGLPDHQIRRVVAPVKSNLAALPTALAFRLVATQVDGVAASQVEWDPEPVSLSADQILAARILGFDDSSELEDAEDFLREQLANGPLAAAEVNKAAAALGIAPITLKRARKSVGVLAEKSSFEKGWLLRLPATPKAAPRQQDPLEEDHLTRRGSSVGNEPLRQDMIPFGYKIGSQKPGSGNASASHRFQGSNLSAPCEGCGGPYGNHPFGWPKPLLEAAEVAYL